MDVLQSKALLKGLPGYFPPLNSNNAAAQLFSASLDNAAPDSTEIHLLQQSWIMLEITIKQFSVSRALSFLFLRADLDVGTSAVAAFIKVILTPL